MSSSRLGKPRTKPRVEPTHVENLEPLPEMNYLVSSTQTPFQPVEAEPCPENKVTVASGRTVTVARFSACRIGRTITVAQFLCAVAHFFRYVFRR